MIALWKCNIEANNIFNYESEIKYFIFPEIIQGYYSVVSVSLLFLLLISPIILFAFL